MGPTKLMGFFPADCLLLCHSSKQFIFNPKFKQTRIDYGKYDWLHQIHVFIQKVLCTPLFKAIYYIHIYYIQMME